MSSPTTKEISPRSLQDVDMVKVHQQGCLFLDKLPLEIRQMMYRYLLVTRYNKYDLDLRSKQIPYIWERGYILKGPDHYYDLHMSIVSTNRRIRHEAMDVFTRENLFMSLARDELEKRFGQDIDVVHHGVAILATGDKARAFPSVSISIDLRVGSLLNIDATSHLDRDKISVFAFEDLPAACVGINRYRREYPDGETYCTINVNPSTCYQRADRWWMTNPRVKQCMDSLSQIRGCSFAEVHGPLSPSSRTAVQASMCSRRLNAIEIVEQLELHYNRGDELRLQNEFELAIGEYKAALCVIDGHYDPSLRLHTVFVGGRFNGLVMDRILQDSRVRLHTLLAESYGCLGKMRLARVYVERIYNPLRSWDDRVVPQKFPLLISTNGNAVYAELLLMAAYISLYHGNWVGAVDELKEASRFDPSRLDITQLLEENEVKYKERRQRREQRWKKILKENEAYEQRRQRKLQKING